MPTKPEISIIIPFFEGRAFIEHALESILAQQGSSWEAIVVDDGSRLRYDDFFASCDPRIRFIRKEHGGKGSALNHGVREAKSEIVCFLDQDDALLPGRFRTQLPAFSSPGVDAVYSDYERVTDKGAAIDTFTGRQAPNEELLHSLSTGKSLLSMQTIMLTKRVFDSVGGFSEDETLTGLDDGEFFVRLICSGARFTYMPGTVARWVSHAGNLSKGARFNEARAVFLGKLEKLRQTCPLLETELPRFTSHNRHMRGVFYLENDCSVKARGEFLKAIRANPLGWKHYYLLAKTFL